MANSHPMLGGFARFPYTAWESPALQVHVRCEDVMQCVKCGGSIEYGLDQCLACGSFVSARAGGVPLLTGASGIPLAQFTPSTQGPPKSRDPYATATIT